MNHRISSLIISPTAGEVEEHSSCIGLEDDKLVNYSEECRAKASFRPSAAAAAINIMHHHHDSPHVFFRRRTDDQ